MDDHLRLRPSRFPDEAVAFRAWQQDYRQRLAAALLGGGMPARVPAEVDVLAAEQREGYRLRAIRYRTQADRTNTALIALPSARGPAPVLVALHGHEARWGEADPGAFTAGHIDGFCGYFAARGWLVVQPATMNHALQHPDWTLQGEWTWDALVALDHALALPGADSRRVAVCGLSTGGHLAMNVLALDDRVRAGVAACILSSWHHYRTRMRIPPHCDCGIRGQLEPVLEQCDWAALAAPKPVQYQHGRLDAAFCPGADPARLQPEWNAAVMPEPEYAALFAEVQRAYRLRGTPDRVETPIHDGEHRVDNAAAWAWLTRWLGRA